MLYALRHDLATAARHLRRAPRFAVTVAVLLAVGVTVNTITFSVLEALVLRALPYVRPDELIAYRSIQATRAIATPALSASDFRDHHQRATSFAQHAAFRPDFAAYVPTEGEPRQLIIANVTADFFDLYGLKPLRGRTFTRNEFNLRAARAIVLAESCWREVFGGRDDVIGTSLMLGDVPTVVVGVMPDRFREPEFVQAWLPFPDESPEYFARDSRFWSTVARLKPGVTLAAAEAEARTIAGALAQEFPMTNQDWSVQLESLHAQRVGAGVRKGVWLLIAAVALVLVIGCGNLAQLLLARGLRRQPEYALRLALGGAPVSLARVALAECGLIGLAGGLAGAALAFGGIHAVARALAASGVPRSHEITLSGTGLLVALGLSLLASLLAGVWPARQARRCDLADALKHTGTRATAGRRIGRVQRALVAGQIALTLVVALAAVALGRSFFALQNAPLGLDVGPVLTAQLAPPMARFKSLFDVSRYFERMIQTVRPLPGVTAVSLDASAPLSGISLRYPVWLEGTEREARRAHEAVFHAVGGDYLDTVGLPLVAGRWFDAHDGERTRSVVVINQALARRLFPDGEALGRRVITLPFIVPGYREIVGIVADAQQDELAGEPPPQIYAPIIQSPWFFGTLLIRLQNPGLGIAPIQAALRAADPTLTMSVQPMAANLARLTLLPRVRAWLFSGFAGVALALSASGIYASTVFAVKQRTRDLAVRLALGGPPRAVVAWVVTGALRVALLGLLLALPAAFALQRLLHGLLVGVPAFEPWAFLVLSALVVLVTIAAAAMPASRAARMNPSVVLQAE